MLGKHFAGALHADPSIDEKLNEFYQKHCYCDYCHYDLELCEEYPCEMTDNPFDEVGADWRLKEDVAPASAVPVHNILVFNRDKCADIDYDTFPIDADIYLASDKMLGHMYCMSFNSYTWTHDGMSWYEFAKVHADEIERV